MEPKDSSMVILKLGLKKQKKFILISYYRQWSLTNPKPIEGDTTSVSSQLKRFKKCIEAWENVNKLGLEVIMISDMNLDSLKWNTPLSLQDQYEKRYNPFRDYLQDKILNNNNYKLDTGITWNRKGKKGESLDLVFTTNPSKIENIKKYSTGESDHDMIEFTRLTKQPALKQRYYNVRNYKEYKQDEFENLIKNDQRYEIAITNTDPEIAAEALTTMLTEHLDKLAPMMRVQVKNKSLNYISNETKLLQEQRNSQYQRAKQTDNQDEWRSYRNLRNQTLKSLRNDEKIYKTNKLDTKDKTVKEIWSNTKEILKWNKSLSPRHLLHNGTIHDSPEKMSNIMNQYYIEKIDKIVEKIPNTKIDPITNYKKLIKNKKIYHYH